MKSDHFIPTSRVILDWRLDYNSSISSRDPLFGMISIPRWQFFREYHQAMFSQLTCYSSLNKKEFAAGDGCSEIRRRTAAQSMADPMAVMTLSGKVISNLLGVYQTTISSSNDYRHY